MESGAQICGWDLPRSEQLKHNGGIVHRQRSINKHFGCYAVYCQTADLSEMLLEDINGKTPAAEGGDT